MHPNSKWWSRPSAGAAGHADGWLAVDAGGGAGDGDEGMVVVGLVVADGFSWSLLATEWWSSAQVCR
ncbi:hypothetical protein I552_0757 [Mycobacterium xenopi 3993]|nr:hypothetical protein I552_0757 [Mycobacterium xenopi 3993]